MVAVIILAGGAALRPKKPVAPQPSPAERANLERSVKREELKEMASIFADRAASVARYMIFLPERNTSGVWWGPQKVLTAPADSDALPIESVQVLTDVMTDFANKKG